MATIVKKYELSSSHETIVVKMPKRARILSVTFGVRGPAMHASVQEDADTRAFDKGHNERFFVVVIEGGNVPEPSVYVGTCQTAGNNLQRTAYHVFEVNRR